MKRSRLPVLAKIAVALVTFGWLLHKVDPQRVVVSLRNCHPAPAAAGIALLLLAAGLQAARLHALVRHWVRSGPGESVRITLASYLFNQLLPGGVGGEGYRAVRLKQISRRWSTAVGLISVERLIGFLALAVPGLWVVFLDRPRFAAAMTFRDLAPAWADRPVVLVVGATLLGVGVLALRWLPDGWSIRMVHFLRGLWSSLSSLSAATYLAVIGLSLAYHLTRIVAFDLLLAAVGQRLDMMSLVPVLTFTLIASLIPVSLGAWGIKEGAIVFGLTLYGVGAAEGLAVALLNRSALLILAAAGGLSLAMPSTKGEGATAQSPPSDPT